MFHTAQQIALLAVAVAVLAVFAALVGDQLAALAEALQTAVESASR